MVAIHINVPDALAQEAARAGLLTPEMMESMLRDRLRRERVERLSALRKKLASDPLDAMTPEEIQAEIEAYRIEQRAFDS
jgi:hypothetical protein